jgi:predicted NAD/FAD-dependent oxidoreductase
VTRVAVIGAGLAGLVAARELSESAAVTVFEKSRGVGGRMATRYEGNFEFDHGAQFFTARSPEFQEYLRPLIEHGVVACWRARFAELERDVIALTRDWHDENPHYVGAPRMNAIGKYLADGLDVRRNTTVSELRRECSGWRPIDKEGRALGHFDWVVLTLPAAQTAALLPAGAPLAELAGRSRMRSCFALMLGFDRQLDLPWHAALVRGADISWVSVNSSKPGRPDCFSLVAHSTNAYADAHIDESLDVVSRHLLDEATAVTGIDCRSAAFRQLQRWRYANADKRDGARCFIDEDCRLAAGGDWFRRGRVEAAFTSGYELAGELRTLLQ